VITLVSRVSCEWTNRVEQKKRYDRDTDQKNELNAAGQDRQAQHSGRQEMPNTPPGYSSLMARQNNPR
jgi:hypothetical protein